MENTHSCTHNPLHCAVPPYMLQKLGGAGKSRKVREAALKTLRISRYFRARRREAQKAFQALGFHARNVAAPVESTKAGPTSLR